MRKTIIHICMAGLALLGVSCSDPGTDRLTVLIDHTDTAIGKPDALMVLELLDFKSDKWKGAVVKRVDICDARYGFERQVEIPCIGGMDGNEFSRKKELADFENSVGDLLRNPQETGFKHSVIYPVIIREVNAMAGHTGKGAKRIVIHSDLVENTPGISFREPPDTPGTEWSAAAWADLGRVYNAAPLDSLDGIDIRIIYKSAGFGDSRRFSLIARMYQSELTKRGASVTITGKL